MKTKTKNLYEIGKEKARKEAINYQNYAPEWDLYYSEIIDASEYFTKLGKRYGLLKEFKENGII